LKELLHEKADALGATVEALEVLPDHVHLFVATSPTDAPQYLANQFKGYTSRVLREEFPALKSRLPSLWSRSYYVGSAGHVSTDTIQKYIEQQKRS
jgi:putative transposase